MLHNIEDLTRTTISILGGGNGSLFNFSQFNHSCSLAFCECNISDNSSNGLCEYNDILFQKALNIEPNYLLDHNLKKYAI